VTLRIRRAARAGLTLAVAAGLVSCTNPIDRTSAAPIGITAVAPVAAPRVVDDPEATAAPTPNTAPITESATRAGFPAQPLAPGAKPPQFVVISFDGAGSLERWKFYRNIAAKVGAHLTYYLSGPYLVPQDKSNLYEPPHHKRGASDIGWADNGSEVAARMEQVRQAYLEGNEIGTHFNGHFCGATGGQAWSSADWESELTQWYSFLDNWRINAGTPDAAPMPFGNSEVIGERTPCLEGKRAALFPVLKAHGFRYDTSGYGYLQWPKQDPGGLWEIPLQELHAAQTGTPVLSMDYNFFDMQSHAMAGAPGLLDGYRQQVLATYRNAYQAVFDGNRAPLIIGHHFADWNGGIYTQALGQFIRETCGRPDTHCVTFGELTNWMEAQDPATLQGLQSLPIQKMSK